MAADEAMARVLREEAERVSEATLFDKFGQAGQARAEFTEAFTRYEDMAVGIYRDIADADPESLVVVVAKKDTAAFLLGHAQFILGGREGGRVEEVDDAVVISLPRSSIVGVRLSQIACDFRLVIGVRNDDSLSTSPQEYFAAEIPIGHPDVLITLQEQ